MRFLFQLPEQGYLRMYASTVRLLAQRGHEVLLAYDTPDKRPGASAAEVERLARVHVVAPVPRTGWRWGNAARDVRLTADFVRYLHPRFRDSPYLRRRVAKYLPPRTRFLARIERLPSPVALVLIRSLLLLDRAIPTHPDVDAYLRQMRADVVLVSPAVLRGRGGVWQTETIKSARRLRIPVAVAVGSWDHLTTKGLIKALPDRVLVWNEVQRREAVELHGIPSSRVAVTGAQLFDDWFERRPTLTRSDFTQRVGLGDGRFLLYVGSSPNITPASEEVPFVRRWLTRLRESDDELLAARAVLVRPHPGNAAEWAGVDLSDLGAAVWPRNRPEIPMTSEQEADYFHSLHYAQAAIGVNTSAMLEAAVVGTPVLTFRADEFRRTQEGTLHFRYLVPAGGGSLVFAGDVDEHLVQLAAALRDDAGVRSRIESFVASFLRPHGLHRPATPIVVDEIERLASVRGAPGAIQGRARAGKVEALDLRSRSLQ